ARRERMLLVGREQRIAPRLAHVDRHRIALGERATPRGRRRRLGLIVADLAALAALRSVLDIDRDRRGREVDVRAFELLGLAVLVLVPILVAVCGILGCSLGPVDPTGGSAP